MDSNTIIQQYNTHIYNRYADLLKCKTSIELNNNDLCKIFE